MILNTTQNKDILPHTHEMIDFAIVSLSNSFCFKDLNNMRHIYTNTFVVIITLHYLLCINSKL